MVPWKKRSVVACADLPVWDSIHNLGLVGHIEDIVVNKDQQGKKLGLRIIEALDYIAEKVGCYKVGPSVFCSYVLGYILLRGRSAGRGCDFMRRIFAPSFVWRHPVRHPTSPRSPPTTPTLHLHAITNSLTTVLHL